MRPILTIWIKPLKTFQYLAQRDDKENNIKINILFFLVSMTAGFSSADDIYKLFEGHYYVILIVSMIFSGFIGMLVLNTLTTYVFLGFSKLFKGIANINEIRLVLAFSLIPNLIHLIVGLVMIIPATVLNDIELIKYQNPITIIVVSIISLRILLYGLAFFNKYSYGYALLTIVIPVAIFQGILYLIKYLNELSASV